MAFVEASLPAARPTRRLGQARWRILGRTDFSMTIPPWEFVC